MLSFIHCRCGASYRVDELYDGRKVKCSRCQRKWNAQIPRAVEHGYPSDAASLTLQPADNWMAHVEPGGPRTSSSERFRSILSATVCIVVTLIFLWLRANGENNHPKTALGPSSSKATNEQSNIQPALVASRLNTNSLVAFVKNFDQLSPAEQERQLPLFQALYLKYLKGILAITKSEWDNQAVDLQTQQISFLKMAFELHGIPKSETHGLSLFLGPFMQSAPPHATLEDGVVGYFQLLRQRQNEQTATDLMRVLNAVRTGADVINVLNSINN